MLLVFVLCAGGLIARLAFWQVMQHGRLSVAAAQERAALAVQTGSRGTVFDALGNPLATDITLNQVYALPKEMQDPSLNAQLISPLVNHPVAELERWFKSFSGYVLLADKVDAATSAAIRRLKLPGIVLTPLLERDYPSGSVAAHTVGYVGWNGRGWTGVEKSYDRLLSGTAGIRTVLRDTAGDTIRVADGGPPSHAGADIHLSINGNIQQYVETALAQAVKKHSADGGTIIVMDPRTGFILGMASTPAYDPNHYDRYGPGKDDNSAVSDMYEPGSTFKVITMSAGIDAGVITPDTAFEDTGQFVVADRVLHNWTGGGFGWETMTQVLQHSANVGAAWVSQRLGKDAFYKYVRAFGFGRPTGIDLPDESAGSLPLPGDKDWTIVNQFTNAYGQGLAVTPLQLLTAISGVANGGILMRPQVVDKIVYGNRVIVHHPIEQRRVMSAKSAHTVTDMLVHSAIEGEASFGLVKGYDIAAKTGTANVAGADGQYIPHDTVASIVGYAPAYHPRFAILVKIDHPRDTPWGSMAAAPVLHDLFQDLFMYYHIPPSPNAINR